MAIPPPRRRVVPVLAAVLALGGCGGATLSPVGGPPLSLQAVPAIGKIAPDVAVARLTVGPGAGSAFTPFSIPLSAIAGRFNAALSDVPEGAGRTFVVEAFDAAGVLVANGGALADVLPGRRTSVVIVLNTVPAAGPAYTAPTIDRFTLTSDAVLPGDAVELAVSARDEFGNAAPVQWSASCGAFSTDPALPAVTWIAPAATGTCQVTVTATGLGASVSAVVPIAVGP